MELDASGEIAQAVGAMHVPMIAPLPPLMLPAMEQLLQPMEAPDGVLKRSVTSYTKAEQVAAIEHYLGVLKGKDRASLYTWFAVTFHKSLKAGTFSQWLKHKDTILAQFRADPARTGSHARQRESITQGLGRTLYHWSQSMEPSQMVVTDSRLLEQAKKIVEAMPPGKEKEALTDRKLFNFSENWLLRWKREYGFHQGRAMVQAPGAPERQGDGAGGAAPGQQHEPKTHLPAAHAPANNNMGVPQAQLVHGEWQPSPNVESAREALRHVQRFLLELRPDSHARVFQAPLCHLDSLLSTMANPRGANNGGHRR